MVFHSRDELEKYKRRLTVKDAVKQLSLKPLIFLVIAAFVSIGAAVACLYDYGKFSLEANFAEFVSFGLCSLVFCWLARGIIRFKKPSYFIRLLLICFLSVCAVCAVLLLNEMYLNLSFLRYLSFGTFLSYAFENLTETEGLLWIRYPLLFLINLLVSTLISMKWFGNLYTRFIQSRLIMNMHEKLCKWSEPLMLWLQKMFCVTEEYDDKCSVFVTGDLHGDLARIRAFNKLRNKNVIRAQDYLAVCGDFGFIFTDSDEEKWDLDYIEKSADYTILFVDGNHENFNAINSYPVEEWCGGKVHRIRKNIIHLMRGQMYNIDGLKVFTMGGAYSIDRYLRRKDISYWEQEIPSDAEYREAALNLERNCMEADVILSHTAPEEFIRLLGYVPDGHDTELTGFLEWILREVKFKRWFFGHWHVDQEMHSGCRSLYYDLVKLNISEATEIKEEFIDYELF